MDSPYTAFDPAQQQNGNMKHIPSRSSSTYSLRHYRWRAFLGIVGPVLLLGFYAFICFYYLHRQPENDILPPGSADANGPFYVWFVVAIFTLDWARTALSNFQAAALMVPRYRLPNAMTLFWHADDNWANPLWWLRAVRNCVRVRVLPRGTARQHNSRTYESTPGWLWLFLSITSILIFVAIPLSGLTMEFNPALKASQRPAEILGPKASNFNTKGRNSLPSIIEGTWKAGGVATPPDSSYFFAPAGSDNVSLTYFEDMSMLNQDEGFSIFLGPAVNELVAGTAFGIHSSLHCGLVSDADLKLIGFHEWDNYNVTHISGSVSTASSTGSADGDRYSIVFLNETRTDTNGPYSFLIAADGAWYGSSPYTSANNIDGSLLAWDSGDGSAQDDPAALLELYLWQGQTSADDPVIRELLADSSPLLTKSKIPESASYFYGGNSTVGFGIQCRVRTAVGNALLDPMRRTYSGFTVQNATGTGTDNDVYAPQIMSLMALSDFDPVRYQPRQVEISGPESRWVSLHQGIGAPASEICISDCDNRSSDNFGTRVQYLALTPENATHALYRLLGQSMIATMSAGSQDAWEGKLYGLQPARWLKRGPVPWEPVFALLALWTAVTVSVSIWTLFNTRWAPTLGGFELFRFGAQYTDDVNAFEAGRFEACERLRAIPGMVGVLPGLEDGGEAGFIGLSETVADHNGRYVYDRKAAAKYGSV